MKKVIVITGPTGVGKTKLSVMLAKYLNTEIINSDAYQIYQDMNIGTAKPTEKEMDGVKHHLMGFLSPLSNFSIHDYQIIVRKKIDEFWENSLVPIMVGGSGLYIDSVLYDYRFNEDGRNRENEKQYDDLSNEELHKILESLNKESADSIHPNNRKRVLRAIELAQNNSSYEDRTLKNNPVYDFLLIFLNDDRDVLYERINARVDEMFENGLLEEVTNLYPDKLGEQAKKAIGYSELYAYLGGFISQEEANFLIKQHSRNYAKRQLTWYRNHKNVNFVNVNVQNLNSTLDEIKKLVDDFLSR
jgi:tRNA dimethylallyltransferase